MKLRIYDKDNILKIEASSDDSCSHQVEIQGENLLNLSFTSYECIQIDVNDYIDFGGERFWAVERYVPEQSSTVEWKYVLKMYGIQSLISRFLVLKIVDGENEPVFSLTAPAASHLRLIVDSINTGMDTSEWKTGECVSSENIVIEYSGTYCNNALTVLAEKAGTEFWFDGTTVNLTRCEHGAPVTLAYGQGLTTLSRTAADNVKFFTRLFPIGSNRNIDRDKYGHTRLQLPGGIKYIDRDIESYGVIHHYEKDAFSHIYPRRVGKVSSVRMTEAKSDDGTSYNIYWFKDDSLDFNPDNYEIGGLVKQVTFQSGELSGRDFEVNWHEDIKEFEIITQWPYDDGRQVPGDSLVPKIEDEYILWNIRMPDEYYPLAEQEYLKAVNAYMEENKKDVSVYKSHTDYIDIDRRKITLVIGQRVRLESFQFFGTAGYKETRITRISRPLDNPTDADIEMSDVLSKGTITEIQDGIEETKSYVDSVSGSLPGIVKSWEGTKLTDTNLMSSAKIMLEIARKAISKEYDDAAGGVITFLNGLISNNKIKALGGIEFGRFQSGKPGAGGAVSIDLAGNSNAEVDYLTVRKIANFNRLMIQEAKHIGGRIIMSSASMLCSRIEETDTVYRCYFEMADEKGQKTFNQFVAGDQAFRQTYNTSETVYYWRLVTAVGDDFIELSKSDCDKGSGIPSAGDEIVQLGHRTDEKRQSAQIMTAYGDSAPSYEVFNGINSFSLAGKNIAGVIYNGETKEPFSYCFGDCYIGDRNIDSSDATFVTFRKRVGDDKKKLHIQADVTLGTGSSGLKNLAEWQEVGQMLDGINQDTILEPFEKAAIRTEWIAINGIESTTEGSTSGSYYNTLQAISNGDLAGVSVIYKNTEVAYNEMSPVYSVALDEIVTTAYLQLRSYLHEIGLNDREVRYEGFDRTRLSELLKVYYDAESIVRDRKVSELEYIEKLFPRGNMIAEGAVFGKLLGVIDSNGNILAGFNGTDLGRDTEHGKALLFAGAKNAQDISTAKTRIYEDGTIQTSSLVATKGKIGDFDLDNWLSAHCVLLMHNNQPLETTDIRFNEAGLRYNYIKKKLNSPLGTSTEGKLNDRQFNLSMFSPLSAGTKDHTLLELKQIYTPDSNTSESNKQFQNVGLRVDVKGASIGSKLDYTYGNFAFLVDHGVFAGLRPMVRCVNESTELTTLDHTIVIDIDLNYHLVLTLPENPEVGQEYLILTNGTDRTVGAHKLRSKKGIIHFPYYDLWSRMEIDFNRNTRIYIVYSLDKMGNGIWWVNQI